MMQRDEQRVAVVHDSCDDCPDDCTNWECVERCDCINCAFERRWWRRDD